MKLFDYNPQTGVVERFHHDPATGKNIIEHIQDVEPFIEHNKIRAASLDKSQTWWYVGTIPDSIIMRWSNECKARPYSRKWRRYAQKQLNKREYRKFNVNNIKL